MKKYLSTLNLLPILLFALPLTAIAQDVIVGDEDDPTAPTTDVTLRWSPNPETDIAGYNVYYGRVSDDYTRIMTVSTTAATITIRGFRPVYFAVTAYNASGIESQLSEEVHFP